MTSTLKSVRNALQVLQLLRGRGPLRLSEIAAALGVSNSSAHRLVSTLREQNFVRQQSGGMRYELGAAMLFSSEVSALEHCVSVSKPVMEELQLRTRETVHLSVLRGQTCLFAASVESARRVRVTSRVGHGPLAHTAAGGKVLLAALDPERLQEVFLQKPLAASTLASITNEAEFWAELDRVRGLGYARNLGESEDDMYALAVPVRRPSGEVISSLTVAAPLSRMSPAERGLPLTPHESDLLKELLRSAGQIEANLAF